MICSESVVSSDIAKSLKDEFSLIQLESIKKRFVDFLIINYLIMKIFITL